MLSRFGKFSCIFSVILFSINNIAVKTESNLINHILTSKKGPVVVFLESSEVNKQENSVEEIGTEKYEPAPEEQDAYVLYKVLRTAEQEEELDTKAARIFEKSKNLLRTAFALRCAKRNSCEQKCPEKKKEGCTANCQKVFDELDACDKKEEKPDCEEKKKPACGNRGRTMPPKWLRSLSIARQGIPEYNPNDFY